MAAAADYLVYFAFTVSRRENVVLFAHFLIAQLRLKKAAASRSRNVLSDQRIHMVAGKSLLRQKYLCTCPVLNTFEYLKIVYQPCLVDNIAGCGKS